jgi:hypothetical protein
MPIIPILGSLRQEKLKFEASLSALQAVSEKKKALK